MKTDSFAPFTRSKIFALCEVARVNALYHRNGIVDWQLTLRSASSKGAMKTCRIKRKLMMSMTDLWWTHGNLYNLPITYICVSDAQHCCIVEITFFCWTHLCSLDFSVSYNNENVLNAFVVVICFVSFYIMYDLLYNSFHVCAAHNNNRL